METAKRVLITDGQERASLALVRSLGRAGFAPYVTSPRAASLAGASRYSFGEATTPDPLTDARAFVARLKELIERWNIGTLIPVAEPALLAVLEMRNQLGDVELPFPDLQSFRRVSDKGALLEAARALQIAVPRQVLVKTPDDAALQLATWSGFPAVIKPTRSVGESNGTRVKQGVSYVSTMEQLRERLAEMPSATFPVLLQERIVGPGVGIFLLMRRGGEVAAQFAHRRVREKPPSGGVSVYRESIPADPDLVARSRDLLNHFDWQGVAMVEYKVDARTGTPYLMEVNGRFWGSLQLAIDAGVDFPVLLLRSSRGEAITPAAYRSGVRSRWWWGDVDQLLIRLLHSETDLALPPDAPSRLRSIADFLHLWRPGDRNEILRWRDPAPFIRESIDWFKRR